MEPFFLGMSLSPEWVCVGGDYNGKGRKINDEG